MCVALALWFLDRSLRAGRMRDWGAYAAALTLAGLLHLLALATVPAPLLLVAGLGRRPILIWLGATAVAGLVVGGVAVAVAVESGDRGWARQLQRELPDAAQPVLGVRVVESVGSLVTSPGPRTSSAWGHGTTWVINAAPSVFPDLARRELGCESARLVNTVGYGEALLSRAVCTTT